MTGDWPAGTPGLGNGYFFRTGWCISALREPDRRKDQWVRPGSMDQMAFDDDRRVPRDSPRCSTHCELKSKEQDGGRELLGTGVTGAWGDRVATRAMFLVRDWGERRVRKTPSHTPSGSREPPLAGLGPGFFFSSGLQSALTFFQRVFWSRLRPLAVGPRVNSRSRDTLEG